MTDSRLRVKVFLLSRLNQSRELFETPIPAEFRQNRLHFLGQSFLRFRNLDEALFFVPQVRARGRESAYLLGTRPEPEVRSTLFPNAGPVDSDDPLFSKAL